MMSDDGVDNREPVKDDTPATTANISRGRYLLLMFALILAEITSAFEMSMIYAALPTLNRAFDDPLGVGWVITSCLTVSAIASALFARLGDMHGRRKLLLLALAGCVTGSCVSAVSSSLSGVIVGAGIQGLAGAILPLCFGLLRELLPARLVAFSISVIVASISLGSGVGLFLGGLLVDLYGWNAIFMASAIMALCGFMAVLVVIPSGIRFKASQNNVDFVRGMLFAPGVVGLLLIVTKMPTWGAMDVRILLLAVTSTLILVVWWRHQWRETNPLINVRFFAVRQIGFAYLAMASVAFTSMQLAQIMSIYLQQPLLQGGLGLSATKAGLLLMPALWIGLVASPVGGKCAEKYGSRVAAMIGCIFLSSGWGLLIFFGSLYGAIVALVTIGIGYAITYASVFNLIVEAAPPERVSEATGVAAVLRAVCMACGALVVMLLLSLNTTGSLTEVKSLPDSTNFQMVFVYVTAGCLMALLAVFQSQGSGRLAKQICP